MSISYKVDGVEYSISYHELRENHLRFCSMTDAQFRAALPEALHLACIISYLKELPNNCLVSDRGIIHLIAHQIHIPSATKHEFKIMRQSFKRMLALA